MRDEPDFCEDETCGTCELCRLRGEIGPLRQALLRPDVVGSRDTPHGPEDLRSGGVPGGDEDPFALATLRADLAKRDVALWGPMAGPMLSLVIGGLLGGIGIATKGPRPLVGPALVALFAPLAILGARLVHARPLQRQRSYALFAAIPFLLVADTVWHGGVGSLGCALMIAVTTAVAGAVGLARPQATTPAGWASGTTAAALLVAALTQFACRSPGPGLLHTLVSHVLPALAVAVVVPLVAVRAYGARLAFRQKNEIAAAPRNEA